MVPDSVKVEAATWRAEAVAVPVSRSREAARAAWEAAESTVICANAPVASTTSRPTMPSRTGRMMAVSTATIIPRCPSRLIVVSFRG